MTSKQEAKEKQGDSTDDIQALESLSSTLEGELTAIDTDAALSAIDEWYGTLHKSKEPALKELSDGLKELKQALKGGKATGHEIGEILSEIGGQTSEIASEADKGSKTLLQKLGKQLSKAGTSLSKAEDQESIEQIQSLTETLEGDLADLEPEAGIGAIDHWYSLLHKSDDEGLKEIATGLKELKQILKRSTAKGADISEALTRLGEQTTEAAAESPRGLKGAIQKLGKLLSKTGKSIK